MTEPDNQSAHKSAAQVRSLLRCPFCIAKAARPPLLRTDGRYCCDVCRLRYPAHHGVPDLLHPEALQDPCSAASVVPSPVRCCLDLGCGPGKDRQRIEAEGFTWCGVDVAFAEDLTAIADAHCLPFGDGVFDRCILSAVLQHLRRPWQAMRELRRCCREGASISGYTAFLEPEHGMSCFHMTRLGLTELLNDSGFTVVSISPASRDGISSRVLPSLLAPSGGLAHRLLLPPMSMLGGVIRALQASQLAIASGADRLKQRHDPTRTARRRELLRDRFAVGFNFLAVAT